jgi:virginiamycin B lyase
MKRAALLLPLAFLYVSPVLSAETAFPEGPGKPILQSACLGCHEASNVTRSGYSQQDWRNVLSMMQNVGSPLTAEQSPVLLAYLTKNFPEKPKPPAVIIEGPVKVSIREWLVPTPGSRPHDPMAARDGSIWYTGQFSNKLGRVDPKTGAFAEFPLRHVKSGPHGLAEDRDGNVWYTANFASYIGKLDPKTGQVTEYPMPDPVARDPHTLVFDKQGMLWFTVQGGNRMGRVDPTSGEVKLVQPLTPRARPYGMVVSSKGVPFTVLFGTNKVASIDPQSMAVREYELPNKDSRPRRIAVTSDDVIWYSDYSRGYLGRLDPASGKVTEWASPSGPQSQPYGIAVIKDVIWYSESNVRPNTVVRFDPKTEKFQTWRIPSGGGIVRNIDVTPDGNLALACSGVNRVALVQIR